MVALWVHKILELLMKLTVFTKPLQNQELPELNLASQRDFMGQYLAVIVLMHYNFSLVTHLQAILASKTILFSLDFLIPRPPPSIDLHNSFHFIVCNFFVSTPSPH